MIVAFANQGQRTENSWSAGPLPPYTINGAIIARDIGPPHSGRRYWLINAVEIGIYAQTWAKPRVQVAWLFPGRLIPAVQPDPYYNFRWEHNGDSGVWKTWNYPQMDGIEGTGFNAAGQYFDTNAEGQVQTIRKGWRPAIATSVLLEWAAPVLGNTSIMKLTRVSHCGWRADDSQNLRANAVAQPNYDSTPDSSTGVSTWSLFSTPTLSIPSVNKVPFDEIDSTPPRILCGPGLFASWENDNPINMQAGFWWRINNYSTPTEEIINDHDPDRIWKTAINFQITGPIDSHPDLR